MNLIRFMSGSDLGCGIRKWYISRLGSRSIMEKPRPEIMTNSMQTTVSNVSCGVKIIVKGIKNGCPRIVEIRGTQGCALVGDPARAVGDMEYKIIKKIRQNTAWIEADILGKNLTPNRCNALAQAIVYVSNDVTIPFNIVTSQ